MMPVYLCNDTISGFTIFRCLWDRRQISQ